MNTEIIKKKQPEEFLNEKKKKKPETIYSLQPLWTPDT